MSHFATGLQIVFLLAVLIALIGIPVWRHRPLLLRSSNGNYEACTPLMTMGRPLRRVSRPARRLWRGRSTFS